MNVTPFRHSYEESLNLKFFENPQSKSQAKRVDCDGASFEKDTKNLTLLKDRISFSERTSVLSTIFPHNEIHVDGFNDLAYAKWSYFKKIEKQTLDGISPKELLIKAIQDQEPEVAFWLIKETNTALSQVPQNLKEEHSELIQWLTAQTKNADALPENLDYLALTLGYGYKSANLMILDKQTDEINQQLKTAAVKVPPFLAISDLEMRHYLFKEMPKIEEEWKQFLASFSPDFKKQYLKRSPKDPKVPPLKITPTALALIKKIQNKIIHHFSQNAYVTPQIVEWLKQQNPDLVIVRSTGKEDTEENSNAGGNDSIPFVKPHAAEISATIGLVLASYFGEKSISQRLLAGDKTLFTQTRPFLPVLLQTMVLESGCDAQIKKDPLDIPRSGVLFTTQKDKAKGITFIQAALGNNEGVVSSQVAVDSYFADKKGNVHSIVRDKQTRFVHAEKNGKHEAVQVSNDDPKMQRAQALPTRVVKDIKIVADAISLHYKKANLDVEYTVKLNGEKPVIYLLQARPLISNDSKTTPSYLDLSKLEKISQKERLSATVLIDIRNEVRDVISKKEVILATTLPQALKAYTCSEDPQKIKAIFVRKSAPATSHESITLRPKGVAVMVITDLKEYAKLESMVEQASQDKPLLIDTQHSMLLSTQNVSSREILVKKGLVSYPIPREISIPQCALLEKLYAMKNPVQNRQLVEAELKYAEDRYLALVNQLLKGTSPFPIKTKETHGYDVHNLLDLIALGNQEEAKRALGTLLMIMHAKTHESIKESKGFQSKYQLLLFNAFEYALTLSEKEIVPALDLTLPESMERLYPLKFLEAVIFQQTNPDIIAADSFANSLNINKTQNNILSQAKRAEIQIENQVYADQILSLLEMGIKASVSKKIADHWQIFMKELVDNKNDALILKTYHLFSNMNDLKLIPLGFNILLYKMYIYHGGKYDDVIQFIENEIKRNQNTFRWIQANQKLLPTEQQIANWEDPKFAEKQMILFKNKFLKTFGFGFNQPDNLVSRFNSASALGKLALLEYMKSCVTAYDTVIKQITGSTQYPEDGKLQAKHFASLLEGYFEMMKSSLKIIPSNIEQSLMRVDTGQNYTFDSFISKLEKPRFYGNKNSFTDVTKKAYSETENPKKLLIARPEFSVAPLVIGSKIDMDFHVEWPATLEEYFTVFHQNMEAVHNVMINKIGFNKNILSDQPELLCDEIEEAFEQEGYPNIKISSMIQNGSEIEMSYNIPLRQHAGYLGVKFNPQKPELGTKVILKMMGNHEHDRWYQTALLGAWLGNSPPLSLADNVCPQITWNSSYADTKSVEFTLQIPQDYKEASKLMQILSFCMATMTFDHFFYFNNPTVVIEVLEKIYPLKDLSLNFFNATRYGVAEVLTKLNKEKLDDRLALAIKTTVLSLLKDNNALIQRHSGHDPYEPLKNCIADLASRNPNAIKPIVEELCQLSELKIKNSNLWNFLRFQKFS